MTALVTFRIGSTLKYTFISHALKATYQGSLCYVHLGSSEVIDSAELTSGASSSVNSQSTVPSAVTEHRRVFNYAGRGAHTFQPQPSRNQKGQKGKKKIQTCTLKMYCLGNVDDEKPPSTISVKASLVNCGLGPGSITCDVHAPSIHNYVLERFPPLTLAGGYELCLSQRGGDDQGFHKLEMPYSPARLKEIAGQATIYVQPLQRNILDEIQTQEQDAQSEVRSVKCQPHIN